MAIIPSFSRPSSARHCLNPVTPAAFILHYLVQAAAVGADPDPATAIAKERGHMVVAQAIP